MKKIVVLLLCLSFGISNAQRKPKIKGNKSVVEVNEALQAFHSVQLEDKLIVRLERSTDPGYSLTADDNLVDVLKFKVEDSTLIISAFYKITGKKELDIVLRYNHLRSISLSDGTITSDETISSDDMILDISGYGEAELRLSNEITNVRMSGNSKANLNIESDSIALQLKEKSQATIYAVSTSQAIQADENTAIDLEGMSDTLNTRLSGNSKLRGQTFEVGHAQLDLSGTSLSRLTVNNYLDLSMTGSSRFYLYGDPEIDLRQFMDNAELYKRLPYAHKKSRDLSTPGFSD